MTPYQVLLQRSILSLTPITIHPGTCTSKLAREGIQEKKRKITSPASRNFTLNAALNLKAGRHSLPTDALLLPPVPAWQCPPSRHQTCFPQGLPLLQGFSPGLLCGSGSDCPLPHPPHSPWANRIHSGGFLSTPGQSPGPSGFFTPFGCLPGNSNLTVPK